MHEPLVFSNLTAPQLRAALEESSTEVLDQLPFGVIRLSPEGKVVYFSRSEAEQSGFRHRSAIGLGFFSELAPCLAEPAFVERVEQARAAAVLDITFEHIGDYDDAERELLVRMLSASDGGVWVCLQRGFEDEGRTERPASR